MPAPDIPITAISTIAGSGLAKTSATYTTNKDTTKSNPAMIVNTSNALVALQILTKFSIVVGIL